MAEFPVISVIVPAYRAEDTLRPCVESLLAGAPANLEVLLVDDDSPDKTGALCDALAAGDGRVKAIHRKNGGASAARNTGIEAAAGSYLMFVDSDDTLLPGLWAELPAVLAGGPDLILFGLRRASGPCPCPLPPGSYASPRVLGDKLEPLLTSGYLEAPYAKLYRAAAVQSRRLRFDPALRVNEDILFNTQFLQICVPIYCLAGVYYYQNDNRAGSLSRSLQTSLFDAEARIRPELAGLLTTLGWPMDEISDFLRRSHTRTCLNQYGLLAGCKGKVSFGRRRALFAAILADAHARAMLRVRLRQDPHRLLALPYRFGVALRLPGWLAFYTMIKNNFLP